MNGARGSIRDMLIDDLPRILEIERASFITPWTEGMFRSQLALAEIAINLVEEEGGGIAGYAAAWVAHDEIHLLSLAVDPASRRRGHASRLLAAVEERGRAKGGTLVFLEVREGNDGARRFYDGHGFRALGTRRGYYQDTGEDAIVMIKVLGGP